MIDTDKYEDAKKMVQDAGLIDENDGHPDIHYRKIALLLAEVKRLREDIQVAIEDIEGTLFHTQEFIEGLLDYLKEMIE
tara:strand:+ start:2641 stop:2877 length:237 start_codon:yes stop_codon:yes gene_type:complete